MKLGYEKVTLEDLEMYHSCEFECDGDSKKVIIRRKESE